MRFVRTVTKSYKDFIWDKVISGIDDYLTRHKIARVADLVGTMETSKREHAWTES